MKLNKDATNLKEILIYECFNYFCAILSGRVELKKLLKLNLFFEILKLTSRFSQKIFDNLKTIFILKFWQVKNNIQKILKLIFLKIFKISK